MGCKINPVTSASVTAVSSPNKRAEGFLTKSKIEKKQELSLGNSPTVGDRFLLAAKETAKELKDEGTSPAKTNSSEISTAIIKKISTLNPFRTKNAG